MNNEIYLSTGAIVEKRNNYNKDEVKRVIPYLIDSGFCDGAELMMIPLYYRSLEKNVGEFLSAGVNFPVTHCDKEVGTILSDAAVIRKDSVSESEKLKRKAFEIFENNLFAACAAGSRRLVLHLWGGLSSDNAVEYNIEWLSELCDAADKAKIKILIENVPSAKSDPLTNLKKIKPRELEKCGFVFDTRFAQCHRQISETLCDKTVSGKIEHVHISDYIGGRKEFSHLRPVYHPGEGTVDFSAVFSMLGNPGYDGTFTLESQGITGESSIDTAALEKSLEFIKHGCENI